MSRSLGLFLLILLWPLAAPAQNAPIRIAIAPEPPLVERTSDGHWHGAAVDLWRAVAAEQGWRYTIIPAPPDQLAAMVASDRADLALPVMVGAGSEQLAYSLPLYTAPLGIARKEEFVLLKVGRTLFTREFLRIALGVTLLLLVVGVAVWAVERNRNPDFGGDRSLARGIGVGFWFAGVTMTATGYGDKVPMTAAGRIMAMAWIILSMVITAGLTAALVSLAGLNRPDRVSLASAIEGEELGVVQSSPFARLVALNGKEAIRFSNVETALTALENGEVTVLLHDFRTLEAHAEGHQIRIDSTQEQTILYAFAINPASPARRPLDAAIGRTLQRFSWWQRFTEGG